MSRCNAHEYSIKINHSYYKHLHWVKIEVEVSEPPYLYIKYLYVPTMSFSSWGRAEKIFLKSSARDLYVGYRALYQDFFFPGFPPEIDWLWKYKNIGFVPKNHDSFWIAH